MPCEFRLRMWLPAMPAYTEWIWQPAISSASSTARCIDCTVDSMLTTTPFFSPRDGCEPRPTIFSEPSAVTSPTIATTFEVPISRPTIIFPLIGFPIHCRGAPAAGSVSPARARCLRPGAGSPFQATATPLL